MSSDVRKGASKQVGNTRAAGKKSRGRRGDVPQGKGQTACMARKKKGAGMAAHAEQRELKPPVACREPLIPSQGVVGSGMFYGLFQAIGIKTGCYRPAAMRHVGHCFAPVIFVATPFPCRY